MKTYKKSIYLSVALLIFATLLVSRVSAQVKYGNKNTASLIVSGTSTLHDWDMKSALGNCEASFTFNTAGTITAINSISFSTLAENLKSGHSAMDKNAYKALKTDKNTTITFVATHITLSSVSSTDFIVKSTGKLMVAGAAVTTEVTATCKMNADKSISVMGSKKISMKDFGMVPPSFMLGTIKTGNEVTLKFDLHLTK